MKNAYDIIIIGGGIVGCSLAFELARRGRKDILIIEKEYLTSGATGRCGAGVRHQWGTALNIQLARDSIRILENLNEYTGYEKDCGLRQGGYLILAYTETEWEQFNKNYELQRSLGVPVEKLDPIGAKDIVPHLNTEGLIGAMFCGKDGFTDPFHCTFAYAKGAKRMGVDIVTYTEVIGINIDNEKITGVKTTKGTFYSNMVINATGGHAPQIMQMVGLDIPIFPERHPILVTEAVNHIQDPMIISFFHRFYCQQTPHGSFVMGIGDPNEPVSYNIKANWSFLELCTSKILNTLPVLKDIRLVRQWAGLYDMTPDRNQIIDEAEGVSGLYTIAGFSGHGFMVAPKTSIIFAQHLCGEKEDIDISLFSAKRYKTGELLLEPSVV